MVAIDVLAMDPLPGVEFTRLDFLDPSAPAKLKTMLGGAADVVLSDMAANATGHRKTDHIKIVALVEAAGEFAREVLAPGGSFLAKVLQGGTEVELLAALKRDFANCAAREAGRQPFGFGRALSAGDGISRLIKTRLQRRGFSTQISVKRVSRRRSSAEPARS